MSAKPILEIAAPVRRGDLWLGAAVLHFPQGDVRLMAEAPAPLLRDAWGLIAGHAGRALQAHAQGVNVSGGCRVAPGGCNGCGSCHSGDIHGAGMVEVAGLWSSIKKAAKGVAKVASATVDTARDVVKSPAWKVATAGAAFIPVVGPGVAGAMAASTAAEAAISKAESLARQVRSNPSQNGAAAVLAATRNAAELQAKALAARTVANREIAASNLVRLAGAGFAPAIVQIEQIAAKAKAGDQAAKQAGQLVTLAIKRGTAARQAAMARMTPAEQQAHDLIARLAIQAAAR